MSGRIIICILFAYGFSLANESFSLLTLRAKNKDTYPMSIKINDRDVMMNANDEEVGSYIKSGKNELKVCFSNPESKDVGFNDRSELQVRLVEQAEEQEITLLRVVNYFGKGDNCRTTEFFLTEKTYASLGVTPEDKARVVAQSPEAAQEPMNPASLPDAQPTADEPQELAELTIQNNAPAEVAENSAEPLNTGFENAPSEGLDPERALAAAEELAPAEAALEEDGFSNVEEFAEISADLPPEFADATGGLEEVTELPPEGLGDEPDDLEIAELQAAEQGFEQDFEEGLITVDEQASSTSHAAAQTQPTAQASSGSGGLIGLMFFLLMCVGFMKLFPKAGIPSWHGVVPFLNILSLLQVAALPNYYLLLLFVPLVNIWAAWKISTGVAKAFGQSTGYAAGLFLLPMVFYPLLGFGPAQLEQAEEFEFDDLDDSGEETVQFDAPTQVHEETNLSAMVVEDDDEDDPTAMTEIGSFDDKTEIAN